MKTFRNIYRHLSDEGYFLFDVNTPTLYQEKHHGIVNHNLDGAKFKQILEYDQKNRIAKTIFDFGNGQIKKHITKEYTFKEIMASEV